ncbi:MAG: type II secretion system F family protein, partial [Candidatus Paceibacterota bacterium]
MKYKYVLERHGERIEGEQEAESKGDLFDAIKQTGDTLISVDEVRGGASLNINLDGLIAKLNRVKAEDKIHFAKNISSMISSGLSMSRALSVIKRQTKNPKFKQVIESVENDIASGKGFADSLAEHPEIFSKIFIAMARAGEESGQLTNSLKTVGEQMERTHTLKKKIKGAMMYPSVIMVAMIIIAILMLIYVVPSLTATFKELDTELPGSTKFIIFVSDALKNNTLLVFGGIITFVIGIVMGLRTEKGKKIVNTAVLYLPVISNLVKESNSATTARTLCSLVSCGVDVSQALEISIVVV